MRWLQSVLVVLALSGAYLGLAHLSGGAFPTPGLQLGGDEGQLRRVVTSFWEDIQFKDFEKAASYHDAATQAGVDIPYLLERLFALKPELLDVLSAEIVLVDLDSSGLRARVKTRLRVKNLADAELYEKEVMLYFKRADPASPWLMDLQTSLRELDVEKDKKH